MRKILKQKRKEGRKKQMNKLREQIEGGKRGRKK
jgi:hypothetical protein